MNKFKKGDSVVVIAGADKGKVGKILSIVGEKATVEGVRIATIHKKPTQQMTGRILKQEKLIHISNVSHIENNRPVKIKFSVSAEGSKHLRKSRISKKSGNKI